MNKKLVIIVLLVVLLGPLVINFGSPIIRGDIKPAVVLSSSMKPYMKAGDIVLVEKTPPKEVETGDVITFEDPSGRENVIITHRVIEKKENGFKTKGDNNENPDQFTVSNDDVIGETIFSVPLLGWLTSQEYRKLSWILLILMPSVVLIGSEMKTIFKPSPVLSKEKRRKKIKERKRRNKFLPKRYALILFLLMMPFLIMLLKPLIISLTHQAGERVVNDGFIPYIVVNEGGNVPYHILSTGESLIPESSVSCFPYIIPVFWAVNLSSLPYSSFTPLFVLFGPFVLSLLFKPLWYKDLKEVIK